MNLLITYVNLINHEDPLLKEFTYGDHGKNARKLKNDLIKGDYVFFHTTIRGRRYITAYYVVDRVLDTETAIRDKNIVLKYKNPHIKECLAAHERGEEYSDDDNCIIFGDPIASHILDRPLLFDKTLAKKLSLNIQFPENRTELQAISSATRQCRPLDDKDLNILLKKIEENQGFSTSTILSTEEVREVEEKDIESYIEKNPALIEESLKIVKRQFVSPEGTFDLLCKDKNGFVVIELKRKKIGREAVKQIRRYMNWVEKSNKEGVRGIIICKDIMPAFIEDFKKLKKIKIYFYGWQFKLYLWEE